MYTTRRRQPSAPPAFATIDDWVDLSGVGRSKTYSLIKSRHIRAIKLDKRTMIDVEHGLEYLRSLPDAYPAAGAQPDEIAPPLTAASENNE